MSHEVYVDVAEDVRIAVPSTDKLQSWVAVALQDHGHDAEISLRIVAAAESRQLNKAYRGKAAPTNVLSFPYEAMPGVQTGLLGDLAICAEVVEREAAEQLKPVEAHWAHMVIHGTLHLLGYDHVEAQDAEVMEALEIRKLAALGIANPYATK